MPSKRSSTSPLVYVAKHFSLRYDEIALYGICVLEAIERGEGFTLTKIAKRTFYDKYKFPADKLEVCLKRLSSLRLLSYSLNGRYFTITLSSIADFDAPVDDAEKCDEKRHDNCHDILQMWCELWCATFGTEYIIDDYGRVGAIINKGLAKIGYENMEKVIKHLFVNRKGILPNNNTVYDISVLSSRFLNSLLPEAEKYVRR